MKKMVKKILICAAAVVCCIAVLVGGVWCSAQCDSSLCNEVIVAVEDSAKHQFVDAEELVYYLDGMQCYPKGDSMRTVDCHAIEQCLEKHDMVRIAECYKTPFGKVHISVEQRVPVLAVVTNEGRYYVDSDRKVMPIRGEILGNIPMIRGAVSKRAATEEYYDFVTWLADNSYWANRISTIHVHNPKYLVLTQEGMSAKIILGELSGYERKLGNLRTLYTKGLDKIGYPEYREYDLRFAKQVVGRK